MKVADYVINFLQKKGIDKVFVVYGAANGDLIDAFTRNKNIEYVCTMHEQAGGFAAEAYSRVSKNFGVAIATSGPGGMNLVTPMGNCFYESIPCMFITGQIHSKFLRKNASIRQNGFQESDIVSVTAPVTKYSYMITEPESIRFQLEKAYEIMMTGRPGPVHLDIPLNIQKADIGDPKDLKGFFKDDAASLKYIENSMISESDLHEFFNKYLIDLFKAKRPCIIAGGGIKLGCKNSMQDFYDVCEILKIPVFPTWNAIDFVSSDYKYYGGRIGTYGGAGRNFGIQNSDLLLSIGSRISGRITGGVPEKFMRTAKKYVVDIDGAILIPGNHDVFFNETLTCSAQIFLHVFKEYLQKSEIKAKVKKLNFSKWTDKVKEWKIKYDPFKEEMYDTKGKEYLVHPYAFARTLSNFATPNDIIIVDCGGNAVVMSHAFETKKGQLFFSNHGNSPMGFSFAASIGAWFASNKKTQTIICVIGDGGFNMNIQELQTLKNYGIGVKVFIMNNHIYGITKAFQKTNFNGRCEACGPVGYKPPDFRKVVEAYDINFISISQGDKNNLSGKIEMVLNGFGKNEPVICDVNCHEYHSYEPRIFGWNTPIEDMYPYLPRDEFLENMIIPPDETYKNPAMPDIV